MAVAIGLLFPILIVWGRSTGNLLWHLVPRPFYLTGIVGNAFFMILATIILLAPISGLIWIFSTFSVTSGILIVGGGIAIGFITYPIACIAADNGFRFVLCASALVVLHLTAWGAFHP
jgi:hypothetical protein